MKKFLALTLVLCMALAAIPALAETDFTGTWYLVTMGQTAGTFELNADAPEDAERVKASIEQKLPGASIMIEHVGPVIGAHAGPGTVALCFIGKETRKP